MLIPGLIKHAQKDWREKKRSEFYLILFCCDGLSFQFLSVLLWWNDDDSLAYYCPMQAMESFNLHKVKFWFDFRKIDTCHSVPVLPLVFFFFSTLPADYEHIFCLKAGTHNGTSSRRDQSHRVNWAFLLQNLVVGTKFWSLRLDFVAKMPSSHEVVGSAFLLA